MQECEFSCEDKKKIDALLRRSDVIRTDAGYREEVISTLLQMSGGDDVSRGFKYATCMLSYLQHKEKIGFSTYGASSMIRENLNRFSLRVYRGEVVTNRSNSM